MLSAISSRQQTLSLSHVDSKLHMISLVDSTDRQISLVGLANPVLSRESGRIMLHIEWSPRIVIKIKEIIHKTFFLIFSNYI